MNPTESAGEHFIQAEKIRRLRLQLADATDEPQRHLILRQIEELEEETKRKLKG